ncbi:UBP1-associated proteins 1C [Diospyros lotus]|uniref:UBP1-associated proteins 1C n=1 Tax=Diospyros lotus TaxID=55363 RepID=UPI002252CE2C|nr:UBP1-associated proteins 1C [Diospyros lotus]
MVWFQCEDCGENLKKPKLLNHFRMCSATKLSCIDCGQTFGQKSVQDHTQCITEAEKYGPKGQKKAPSGATAKPNNPGKQDLDFDVNVGLSERPPWFCSLCSTKTTSKQTLLLHAEGKKHRAKARAFHAAKQQPRKGEESTLDPKVSSETNQKDKLTGNPDIKEPKDQNPPEVVQDVHATSEAGNGSLQSSKKRKLETSEKDHAGEMAGGGDMASELGNGEVIQVESNEKEGSRCQKKTKHDKTKEDNTEEHSHTIEAKKKIKWKKLIKSALKSNPEGVLKKRRLRKLILKALTESGLKEDERQVTDMLEQKISSSSRFMVDDKYVRLVSKS